MAPFVGSMLVALCLSCSNRSEIKAEETADQQTAGQQQEQPEMAWGHLKGQFIYAYNSGTASLPAIVDSAV
jgi:hypothetical protein